MTLVLGARCKNGVAIVSDKILAYLNYDEHRSPYEEKTVGDILHVVYSYSGLESMFQFFKKQVVDYVLQPRTADLLKQFGSFVKNINNITD